MITYLKSIKLLNLDEEYNLICAKKNIHNNLYPCKIFPEKELEKIIFDPITIFYGGNGSGKTTLLNIISSKLNAEKKNDNKKGELYDDYISKLSDFELSSNGLKDIKFISSDDVFDYILDLRAINDDVVRRKELLKDEYYETKYKNNYAENQITDYEELKNKVDARRYTVSKYIRTKLGNNTILEKSNGESALEFWQNEIKESSVYLLDEPENSLSAENQIKLALYIEESARFYDCQFIIATHSPFFLSLKDAKIYDIDSTPVITKKWTDLENVKVYFNFFQKYKDEFKEK